jgi:regulator of protease activity HflC (stomatin/prohibitin superfamily)
MESAFAWIGYIVEWIGRWLPRIVILDVRVAGVKFIRGGKVKVCPAGGLYFYWPIITTFDTYTVVRQVDDLKTQTFVTRDDKVISVGGMIVYSIHNIEWVLTRVHSPERTINDITLTCIHDVCCKMDWETLKSEQRAGTLDTKLKNAAKNDLFDYGVRVEKVMLTDLAPCRVLKIVQSVANDSDFRG